MAPGQHTCSQESPKGCSAMSLKFRDVIFGKGRVSPGSPAALTHSGCPTLAGAAGRRAGRRLGRRRCRLTSRCGRKGTCPPPACTSAPRRAQGTGWDAFTTTEPPDCPRFGGKKQLGGKGQGLVPFPFLWRVPSSLWLRASSAQRRCCSSDKPGAGAARQGQEGGQEAATPAGQHPTLLLWSQGTESGTSVCLQETTYFLQERNNFPYGGTQTTHRPSLHPVPSPPLLPPPSPHPTCFFRSPVQPNFFPSAGFSVPPLSVLINGKSTLG